MSIAHQFIALQKYPIRSVLRHCKVAASVYYYKPKQADLQLVRGIKQSVDTLCKDGNRVSNVVVIGKIKALLSQEFVDYGYLKITYYLQDECQYLINHKKVYRLMSENKLLNVPIKGIKGTKTWVSQLVPTPQNAFEQWEFDIKFIYIAQEGKYAPMLSIIDVYSRYLIAWQLEWSIKKEDVKALFTLIFQDYQMPKSVIVRCDNGSQFESYLLQEYFKEIGVVQEFTKPATPEQNAHIESYHSIIERAVCRRCELKTLWQTQDTFRRWVEFYNAERIHSGVGYTSPEKYLKSKNISWKKVELQQKSSIFESLNETEASHAAVQLERDNLAK